MSGGPPKVQASQLACDAAATQGLGGGPKQNKCTEHGPTMVWQMLWEIDWGIRLGQNSGPIKAQARSVEHVADFQFPVDFAGPGRNYINMSI